MKNRLLVLLFIAVILTPLGLLTDNPAWGEWEPQEFEKLTGFIPQGIASAKPIINAVIPDYKLEVLGAVPSYYLSAILGVILCMAAVWLFKPKSQA